MCEKFLLKRGWQLPQEIMNTCIYTFTEICTLSLWDLSISSRKSYLKKCDASLLDLTETKSPAAQKGVNLSLPQEFWYKRARNKKTHKENILWHGYVNKLSPSQP